MPMPNRAPVRILMLMPVLLLAGCGPQVLDVDVTRFHTLAPASAPRSFSMLPGPNQRGSLEFESYAQLVGAELESRGWRPVAATAGAEPEAVVFVHWALGQPRTETWQSPTSVWGGYGWGPHPWWGGGAWYDPFPYSETRSITYYPKWLSVDILDGPSWRDGKPRRLFEGRAVAEGTRPILPPAIPYLVRALFTDFPGANGQTVNVELPVGKG